MKEHSHWLMVLTWTHEGKRKVRERQELKRNWWPKVEPIGEGALQPQGPWDPKRIGRRVG